MQIITTTESQATVEINTARNTEAVEMHQSTGWRIILNWLKAERGRGGKAEGDGRTETCHQLWELWEESHWEK